MTDTEQVDPLAEPSDFLLEPADEPSQRVDDVTGPTDPLTQKSQWSNWTVLALIILCFFVIVRFRPFDSRNPQQLAGVGKRLSQLKLEPLTDGAKPISLADLTGRVVLIHFWETGSSMSREALPHMAAVQREFRDQPAFMLLSVACTEDGSQDSNQLRRGINRLLRTGKIEMVTYTDPGGVSRSALDQVLGPGGLPTTLILDRRGRIRAVWIGFRPGVESQMQQLVADLLAEA